jgi:hypothetical protein
MALPPGIEAMVGTALETLSSAKGVVFMIGLFIVGAVIISYTIYGIYKFGIFALRLKPHYFGLAMFLLGFTLILISMLFP